ncbi:hypothetical protein OsJ_18444 [Oryza sativa Japonica Group]|uniref:Uncharacterized protein n=4 Tax=Oryza TaxID=4527 RepID=B9FI38_ORYSJ|nr:hypothetical protein OsJ_18444 [Oryza sativa Japonica Group]
MGKRLEKIQSAAREQKAKLYIIVACIALLVCGCTTAAHHHQRKGYRQCKSARCIWLSTAILGGSRLISSGLSSKAN